jgi:endonuclease YncB( thermonuclease family)
MLAITSPTYRKPSRKYWNGREALILVAEKGGANDVSPDGDHARSAGARTQIALERKPQKISDRSLRVLTAALLFLGWTGAALPGDMIGKASIIDGDTLEIHGTRIRLWGIDAPESDQLCRGEDSLQYRCGAKTANELAAFIGSQPVTCEPVTIDRYGRTVASCAINGTDLSDWLVRQGLALDWPRYSNGRYSTSQDGAHRDERGIWAGSYVELLRFRECVRLGGRPAPCSDAPR